MVAVRLYVEGGGDTNRLRTACRRGFREFFLKAGLAGSMPRIIASGSRRSVYEDFCTAISQSGDVCVCLLVDSEEAVADGEGPWDHLKKRQADQWPPNVVQQGFIRCLFPPSRIPTTRPRSCSLPVPYSSSSPGRAELLVSRLLRSWSNSAARWTTS